MPGIFAHGAPGSYDEILFLGIGVIFLSVMAPAYGYLLHSIPGDRATLERAGPRATQV